MSRSARVAALGGVLVLLAAAFGVAPLYVPGVALILLAAAAQASARIAARWASVTLELTAASVEEGRQAPLTVRSGGWPFAVSRGTLQPLPGAAFRPVGIRPAAVELAVAPTRRGEHSIGPATVRFGDPFRLCNRELHSSRERLLVLPRVERIGRESLERALGLGRARVLLDDGPDVEGLRTYRPGAPASRIHWLTVARVGELVERRSERDTEDMPFMIVLDAGASAGERELDLAVRAAASLCVGVAGVGGCSLLLPGDQEAHAIRPDLASWPYLHARLAMVRSGARPVWAVADRARAVIWVGARAPDLDSAGRGSVCCTVSPLPRRGRPVLFDVAGCSAQASGRTMAGAA